MIKLKAWNARPLIDILSPRHWHFPVLRNSRAIAKFHNAEIGHFGRNAFIHELIRGSLGVKGIFCPPVPPFQQGSIDCRLERKAEFFR
ncbi:hypothetical protein MnTg03_00119 [bacterium MnTg03]|nr:hypothetical protein MnTg03_00119 [bacterium MnTg03]